MRKYECSARSGAMGKEIFSPSIDSHSRSFLMPIMLGFLPPAPIPVTLPYHSNNTHRASSASRASPSVSRLLFFARKRSRNDSHLLLDLSDYLSIPHKKVRPSPLCYSFNLFINKPELFNTFPSTEYRFHPLLSVTLGKMFYLCISDQFRSSHQLWCGRRNRRKR